jgi:hypothetical protein
MKMAMCEITKNPGQSLRLNKKTRNAWENKEYHEIKVKMEG